MIFNSYFCCASRGKRISSCSNAQDLRLREVSCWRDATGFLVEHVTPCPRPKTKFTCFVQESRLELGVLKKPF